MYILMLSVVFVMLVIISILISNGTITNQSLTNFQQYSNPYLYTYNDPDLPSESGGTLSSHMFNGGMLPLPGYLLGSMILNIDFTNNTCIKSNDDSQSIGFYNLSVRKMVDGYRGVVRGSTWNGCCTNNIFPSFSYPYTIELDNDGSVQHINRLPLNYDRISNCRSHFRGIHANGIEDPRLFIFDGEEWIIGNCLGSNDQPHSCVNAMCLFKLSEPENTFKIIIPPVGVDPLQRQKNWSAFEWNGKLLCEYSIVPHVILEIDPKTGMSEEIYRTGLPGTKITEETSLRGGTCPILINHDSHVFYLGIGHIRIGATLDYFHFFYTFEAEPPFNINKISKYFKFDGTEKIQFATGLSCYDDMLYISYGVDDCYNRISGHVLNYIMTLL